MRDLLVFNINLILALPLCLVLSRFEKRQRGTKVAGTVLAYYFMGCFFWKLGETAREVSELTKLPTIASWLIVLSIFILATLLSRNLLLKYFGEHLRLK